MLMVPRLSRRDAFVCSGTSFGTRPLVQDANGLALAPRDGAWRHQLDLRGQVEGVFERRKDAGLERCVGSRLRRLYPHAQVVLVVRAGAEDDLVVGFEPIDAQQGVLDLGGEDVHPAYDEHVVRAAEDPGDAGRGPAAGARLPGKPGKVPGAVPENGERLLGGRAEDQLADLTVRQSLT